MRITTIFYVFEIFYSLYFFLLLISRRFARVLRRLTQQYIIRFVQKT